MVKHIILWSLKEEYTNEQKEAFKQSIKKELEGLKGNIPGLIDITVQINGLESSNTDLMLDSTFESYDALKAYAINPKHVYVADTFVRPHTAKRSCFDFEA